MDEQEILKQLVDHFGQENEEEIAYSLEQPKYGWGEEYEFEVEGEEWTAFPSEEAARGVAIRQIEQDLREEPEMFTQSWLQNFITISDTDRRVIASEEANDYAYEVVKYQPEDYVDELEVPIEFQDDPEEWHGFDDALEKLQEERYEQVYRELEDPIQYFVEDHGIYSIEDLFKASFIMIDVEAAAEEAVNVDGWAHFLSRYDGNYEEIDGGVVIFRRA